MPLRRQIYLLSSVLPCLLAFEKNVLWFLYQRLKFLFVRPSHDSVLLFDVTLTWFATLFVKHCPFKGHSHFTLLLHIVQLLTVLLSATLLYCLSLVYRILSIQLQSIFTGVVFRIFPRGCLFGKHCFIRFEKLVSYVDDRLCQKWDCTK